jgi:hypothetical protein
MAKVLPMFDEPEFDEPDDEFDDEEVFLPDHNAMDLLNGLAGGVQYVTGTLYEHRTTIRNVVFLAGGAFILVKGPPIAAKSLAETMHYLREAWYGRGYEDRWKT